MVYGGGFDMVETVSYILWVFVYVASYIKRRKNLRILFEKTACALYIYLYGQSYNIYLYLILVPYLFKFIE